MTAPTPPAPSAPRLRSPIAPCPDVVATAARLGADASAVWAALDEFDAVLLRRAQRRRVDVRALLAELAARDGEPLDEAGLEAEAERVCGQEDQERLAAELRRLATPDATAIRTARDCSDALLERCCQAAVDVLATLPHSLAEFEPDAERRHAAEQAVRDGLAKREAEVTRLLEEAGWWRRRGWRRELAGLHRDRQAAEQRLRVATARVAAVRARQGQRAAWLARPDVARVLAVGATALRALAARAEGGAATAELAVVDRPVPDRSRAGRAGSGSGSGACP
jgi:hypothetical protein